MITTNIDAETTNEKIQALLDYLNEEKYKSIKLCFLCFMLVRLLILKGENLWIIIL